VGLHDVSLSSAEPVVPISLQVAHNQIWLFEAVDANEEDDEPPPYEVSRYPEITARGYYIKNIGTGQYIYTASSPWRFYPGGRSYAVGLVHLVGE